MTAPTIPNAAREAAIEALLKLPDMRAGDTERDSAGLCVDTVLATIAAWRSPSNVSEAAARLQEALEQAEGHEGQSVMVKCADLRAALCLRHTPGAVREAAARIVDPAAWAHCDSLVEQGHSMPMQGAGCADSLAKADAILILLGIFAALNRRAGDAQSGESECLTDGTLTMKGALPASSPELSPALSSSGCSGRSTDHAGEGLALPPGWKSWGGWPFTPQDYGGRYMMRNGEICDWQPGNGAGPVWTWGYGGGDIVAYQVAPLRVGDTGMVPVSLFAGAFITCESTDMGYAVQAKFSALKQAQEAHRALAGAARYEGKPVAWVSPGQLQSIREDRDGEGGAGYLPIRLTQAGLFTMPLYAEPVAPNDADEQP